MKKYLLLLIATIIFSFASAQEFCSFDQNLEKLENANPAIKEARLQAEAQLLATDIQKFLIKNGHYSAIGKSETIYEIPVVVHLMNDGTTPLRTDAEVIKWIDDCNKFYNTTYGGEWYTTAQGGTIIPFKLVLAKRTSDCRATTGINQVNVTANYPEYSTKGLNSSNSDGIEATQLRQLSRWDPKSYYNIYIVNTFDSVPVTTERGVQGFAGFPTYPDDFYDTFMKASVVINTISPVTLPHEFGHSLGMHHPFKTGSKTTCPTVSSGGCATDNDYVCDTPSTKNFVGETEVPVNGSPNPCDAAGYDNVQYNIMNYTPSNRLFTHGQKNRGLVMFLQNRGSLTTSLGGTAPSGSAPILIPASCVPNAVNTELGDQNYGPTLVKIGTINNISESSNEDNDNKTYYKYSDLVCGNTIFSTNLDIIENPQTITLACETNDNIFNVYIDYNNDGAFNETNEKVIANYTLAADTIVDKTFSIPTMGVTLDTPLRMRVIAGDKNYNSCSNNIKNGQVEDYMVTISNNTLGVYPNSTKDKSISIYPNPSNDGIFSIKFADSSTKEVNIAIMDMTGKIVYQAKETANNNTLKVNSKLSKGNYLVKITTGTFVTAEKFIIK
jgi:hypothetical protein